MRLCEPKALPVAEQLRTQRLLQMALPSASCGHDLAAGWHARPAAAAQYLPAAFVAHNKSMITTGDRTYINYRCRQSLRWGKAALLQ